jgi:predicted ATPase
MHLDRVVLHPERYPTRGHYPFNPPILQQTPEIELDAAVTLFVGENGTGKSTLLEAMAVTAGIHIWRADRGPRLEVNRYEDRLPSLPLAGKADSRRRKAGRFRRPEATEPSGPDDGKWVGP